MAAKKPPPIDAKRLIWSSDWFVNDVELPMELPAPVSNNELTRRAAKLIRKHAGGAARGGEADRLVLYWSLRESALLVHVAVVGSTARLIASPYAAAAPGSAHSDELSSAGHVLSEASVPSRQSKMDDVHG